MDQYPIGDDGFEDSIITKVDSESDGSWSVAKADGWSCWVPNDSPVVPVVGMKIRCYMMLSTSIRGMFLDGQKVYYRTEDEQHAIWDDEKLKKEEADLLAAIEQRPDRDRRWKALPIEFQKRRDRFMAGNPNFARDFETYELFCCEQAVAIHDAMNSDAEKIRQFRELTWNEQKALAPKLDDGHSGNTFGSAIRLAYWLATNKENVVLEHGALATLVGCKAYGCTHVETV